MLPMVTHFLRTRHWPTAFFFATVLVAAHPSAAQVPDGATRPSTSPDIVALRAEVNELRDEVSALRALLADLRTAIGDRRSGPQAAQAAQVTPAQLEMLQSQVADLAQTKVESASRQPVKLSGTILSNTFFNSGSANWLENPNLVDASAAGSPTGSMSGTVRQSRIGLAMTGVAVGEWTATGAVLADFFGGTPGFQTGTAMGLPRLVYAFGRLEREGTAIQIGQDHVLLAPRDPSSLAALSFPMLFRSGNLYLRAPQVRVEQDLGRGWHSAIGIVAPIAGDAANAYQFAPEAGAGERSKTPAFQARLGVGRDNPDAASEAAFAVSGHVGKRRSAGTTSTSWAAAVDFRVRTGRIGAAGEWFIAENAEAFGGALSQPGKASGGWIEGQFALSKRASLNAGAGIDTPDAAAGVLARVRNRTMFGNVMFAISPELAASIEYRWLETRGGLQPVNRRNHHLNAAFAVRF